MQQKPKVKVEPPKQPAGSPPDKPVDTSVDTPRGATDPLSEEELRTSFGDADEGWTVQDGSADVSTESKATAEGDQFWDDADALEGLRDSMESHGS